jgi:hypothetical protein
MRHGYRDLTEEEKFHLNQMNNLCTEEEKLNDMLTDGNTQYWREIKYAREHNIEYLLGYEEKQGKKYNWNNKMVRDNNVRGTKLYSFEIV